MGKQTLSEALVEVARKETALLKEFYAEKAAALVKANRFIEALEGLRKSGDAARYRGNIEKVPLEVPTAVVTIDSMTLDDAVGQACGTTKKYALVLGVPSAVLREQATTKQKFIDHYARGDFKKKGRLTGWRGSRYGWLHLFLEFRDTLQDIYVISFIPLGKRNFPPQYDPGSVQNGLRGVGFDGHFIAPSSFGSEILADVARGLKRCLEQGVLFNPSAGYNAYSARIENLGDLHQSAIYHLSQNAFSQLKAVCSQETQFKS